MSFFDDLQNDLLEAIEMEKGNIPLTERKGMPAKTYYVADDDKELLNQIVEIRKSEHMTQSQVADLIGSKQQVISRMETGENSPSLKLFNSVVNALGYELRIEKKMVSA
ncbi:MAG: helix-turn-helix domain-containing protein [Lachnospiraceae bacterium]|nr:helix-turn-helix domain-containing protein [Lachnospiraceae bacterium]